MMFESCYEKELRLSLGDKEELLAQATVTWLFVDGQLAGETYGLPERLLNDDEREDIMEEYSGAAYCYSTTILPPFQRRGLSKILKAYWLGQIKGQGYELVCGHATSDSAIKLNTGFGAVFGNKHTDWYGSGRDAVFYTMKP
jgi:hypothetical protein